MKRALLALLLCLAPASSCSGLLTVDPSTGNTTINLKLLHLRIAPLVASTGTWANAFDAAGDEDTASAFRSFSETLGAIDVAVVSGIESGGVGDIQSIMSIAIDQLDELAMLVLDDGDRQAEYLIWIGIAQALLGQIIASV